MTSPEFSKAVAMLLRMFLDGTRPNLLQLADSLPTVSAAISSMSDADFITLVPDDTDGKLVDTMGALKRVFDEVCTLANVVRARRAKLLRATDTTLN